MSNDIIIKSFKSNFAKNPTFFEVSCPPLFSCSIVSPIPIEETMVAKREILQQGTPTRYSSIKKAYRPKSNRHFHINKLNEVLNDLEKNDHSIQRPKTAPIPDSQNLLTLKNKMGQPLKYLRRHMTINGDTNSLKRYNSSDLIRYTLHDKDLSRHKSTNLYQLNNKINTSHQDQYNSDLEATGSANIPSTVSEYARDNIAVPPNYRAVIQQPDRLLSSSYGDYNLSKQINEQTCQSLTHNSEANLRDIMHSNHSSTIISQFSSPKYVISSNPTHSTEINSGTILPSSFTLPQSFLSHLSFMNKKLVQSTKTWFPYFTFLTTIIMFTYFIASITVNFRLTGQFIKTSPINIMVGPSTETLIYIGARYVPCIKPTNTLTSAAESIYNCPTNGFINENSTHSVIHNYNQNNSSIIDFKKPTSYGCNLQNLCGGTTFQSPDKPDQGYRFVSALFVHSGLLSLILNAIIHVKLGSKIERVINPFRYGAIWIGSGAFGYIFGAVFTLESNVSAGCSVAMMGVIAFLFIDLIKNWNYISNPCRILLDVAGYFFACILLGFLPGYDNFAHLGGFVGGLMISLIVLPIISVEISTSDYKETKNRLDEQTILLWMMRIMATAFMAILMWIALHLLMEGGEQNIKVTLD